MDWRRDGPMWLGILMVLLSVIGAVAVFVYDATRPTYPPGVSPIAEALRQYESAYHGSKDGR
jgi:hypothetical protein